jgi:serine/threonine protein kinase
MMDRRRDARIQPDSPDIGILRTEGSGYIDGTALVHPSQRFFVDIINRSATGALLKSMAAIDSGTELHVSVYDPAAKTWYPYEGSAVWALKTTAGKAHHHLIGVAWRPCSDRGIQPDTYFNAEDRIPAEGDYEFFRRTELMRSLPRDAVVPLVNSIFYRFVKAGDRFIVQGAPGETCYLVQHGTCVALLEKGNQSKIVARLRAGSIVGEMALLTGEPRSAHVLAETDVELWGLTREQYDRLSLEYPELRAFLTTVLTRWFDTRTVIAERHIGKYTITDILGQGAYAIVYKGRHRDLNMPVAVKMMRHDMAMEPEFIDSFHTEAKTIARFNHPNIVKIYDIEERYRTVFIVMEYLEGTTLEQVLDTLVRLPAKTVVKYLRQICQGLGYAHRQNIVHQDIKPGNIFILPNDDVKIVDFGLSCTCGSEMMMAGTPFYMSPEQIECIPVDTRTDIYALGIMAFEMMTGSRPYPEKDAWKVMDLHVTKDIPDPAESVAEIPEHLRTMILKSCARDPSQRYQSVDEILVDLYPLIEAFDLNVQSRLPQKNQMTRVSILHEEAQREALDRMLMKFKKQIEEKGMQMKISSR